MHCPREMAGFTPYLEVEAVAIEFDLLVWRSGFVSLRFDADRYPLRTEFGWNGKISLPFVADPFPAAIGPKIKDHLACILEYEILPSCRTMDVHSEPQLHRVRNKFEATKHYEHENHNGATEFQGASKVLALIAGG